MLAAIDLLDQITTYIVFPVMFLGAFGGALLGYGVIPAGTPDKGDEASLAKRLGVLRWLCPLLMVAIAAGFILKITGVL